MSNVIIFGLMGSGKDTVAKLLEVMGGYNKIKLGGPIRQFVDANAEDSDDKRALYQGYGQAMREMFGEDIWNKTLFNAIDGTVNGEHLWCIADGRQENELGYWLDKGFTPVGLLATEEVRRGRLMGRDGVDQSHRFTHDTEIQCARVISQIVDADYPVIENNGSVEDLIEQVRGLCHLMNSPISANDGEMEGEE